ncbi:MAG: T9SS type A sorting domain-containing protein, partial [Bacteroidota bacterium]
SISLPEFWEVEQSNSRILIRYAPPVIRTWTGAVSSDWETAGNWSPQVVPGEETDVIIPNVNTNDPIIDEPIIFCKSLVIEELGFLSVSGDPSDLVILNPDEVSITINGKLFIGAGSSLAFGSFGTTGIQVNTNGELENEGNISKGTSTFVAGNFIHNAGTVINSGTISIEGFGGIPLQNEPTGVFSNEGELKIADASGTSFTVNDEALWNRGSFDIGPNGTLTISYHEGVCISNTGDGVFDNFGTINLGQRGNAAITGVGIRNAADFFNFGEMKINNLTGTGILASDGSFANTENITIGRVLAGISGIGIAVNAAYDNSGSLFIDNTTAVAIDVVGTDVEFTNRGLVEIGADGGISGQGIQVGGNGTFTNGEDGTVSISNAPRGIDNEATFTNEGELVFEVLGPDTTAIQDFGDFTNNGTIAGNAGNMNFANDLGGTLAPGFSPGTFAFESSQRFVSGAVLQMDVEGTGVGNADRLIIAGVVNLDNLNLEVTVNYDPEDGDRIDLINAAVVRGTLASVSLPPGWELLLGPSVAIRFDASILPVELTDFTAAAVGKTVVLDWTTAAEIDNEGFQVMHAFDGVNWEVIGFVAGNGNTEGQSDYTFTHPDPVVGENYYRLRQLDFDGQFADSPVRVVVFEDGSGDLDLQVYPNPSTDLVYVAFPNRSTDQTLRVVNGLGQVMYETTVAGGQNQVTIDLEQWPSGTYFVTLGTEASRVAKRLLKQSRR